MHLVSSGEQHLDRPDELADALARLPHRCRAAVVLRFYEQLTVSEIATTLGISDGAVKSSLDNEPRMAVVPIGHRLAGEATVSLADLTDENLVVSSVTGTTTLELWPDPPRPTIGADLETIDDWLIAIAAAIGVGVTPASTVVLHPHPDVRFIPIHDAPTVPLVLVWLRHNPHPHTKAFVATARHALARAGRAAS